MAAIREKMESVYVAVAFAERDEQEEAVRQAKADEERQERRLNGTRKDKRPRVVLRAE
ncbi:hypothetical protein M7784_04210 [Desulfovibrio aminophilus]|nr:hypothetical protein [Desulfovibrio aminophilus]MCM0754447.1 hypothetical protein [Desulfovibrio aminophilus]